MADYLIHYNKNHHPKTGRFDFGDGDGDGIRNDHANADKESFGSKVRRAVDTYDRVSDEYRGRVIKNEEYKVKKGDLRLQQDEIARQRTSAKSDEKRDKLDLARTRKEMQAENRLRRLDEKRLRRELMAEREAARREQRQIKREEMREKQAERQEKRMIREEKARQRQIIKEQQDFNRLVQKEKRRIAAEQKATANRQAEKSKLVGQAVVLGLAGMPISAVRKLGGAIGSKNRSGQMLGARALARTVGTVAPVSGALIGMGLTNSVLGKGFAEDLYRRKI